jgi:hypothetical protein
MECVSALRSACLLYGACVCFTESVSALRSVCLLYGECVCFTERVSAFLSVSALQSTCLLYRAHITRFDPTWLFRTLKVLSLAPVTAQARVVRITKSVMPDFVTVPPRPGPPPQGPHPQGPQQRPPPGMVSTDRSAACMFYLWSYWCVKNFIWVSHFTWTDSLNITGLPYLAYRARSIGAYEESCWHMWGKLWHCIKWLRQVRSIKWLRQVRSRNWLKFKALAVFL